MTHEEKKTFLTAKHDLCEILYFVTSLYVCKRNSKKKVFPTLKTRKFKGQETDNEISKLKLSILIHLKIHVYKKC